MPPGKGIVINISADPASTKAALEVIREQMRQTAAAGKKDADELAAAWNMVRSAVGGFSLGIVLNETVSGIKQAVAGSVALGVELNHLSQETGISTANLSVLKYAADSTGVGFETLTKSFRKFSVEILNAEEGKKQSIRTFERLGISQAEVKQHGNDMLGMLGMVADRFKTLPEGPTKSAEAVALFGRAGMAMIPILNQGSEGIARYAAEARSLGIVLDQDGVDKLQKLHEAMVRVQGAMEGAQLGITAGLEPALLALGGALTDTAGDGSGMVSVGQKLGDAMLDAAAKVAYLTTEFAKAKAEFLSFQSYINAPSDKFWSTHGVTPEQRASASARLAADDQDPKDAQAAADRAQKEYDRIKAQLAAGYSGNQTGQSPAELEAARKRQDELRKQLRGLELQDQSKTKAPKSDNAIPEAAARLAEAQAQAIATARKAADEQTLSEDETLHKMLQMSDQKFYAEKLRLELDALDAEQAALTAKRATLAAHLAAEKGDKTLKRDKTGVSAEELNTQREMVALEGQMAELATRRARAQGANDEQVNKGNLDVELAGLRAAAELEKQKDAGITAQLALLRREAELKAQASTNAGGTDADAAAIRGVAELEAKKLEAAEVSKQIAETEQGYKLRAQEIEDRRAKGQESKMQAERQLNQLHADEAKALQELIEKYDALAATLGGDFKQKAEELHAELAKLQTPDKSQEAQFGKTLTAGMIGMTDTLVELALRGKASFRDMAKTIEADAIKLALRLAAMKLLNPSGGVPGGGGGGGFFSSLGSLFGSGGGSGGQAYAGGTDFAPGGTALVGEKGPELVNLPRGASVTPNNVLSKIAEGGGAARTPNITTNVINQSSQPVSAQPSQVSYDSEMREFVIHTILTDHASGGPTSAIGRS